MYIPHGDFFTILGQRAAFYVVCAVKCFGVHVYMYSCMASCNGDRSVWAQRGLLTKARKEQFTPIAFSLSLSGWVSDTHASEVPFPQVIEEGVAPAFPPNCAGCDCKLACSLSAKGPLGKTERGVRLFGRFFVAVPIPEFISWLIRASASERSILGLSASSLPIMAFRRNRQRWTFLCSAVNF